MSLRPALVTCAFLFLVQPVAAQWSSDPLVNFSLGDGAGDQVQAKVASTDDGGAYISWFDSIGNGFDVRVQKLDAAGNEVFAHNGVLVADRDFSSTQDYSLDVDAAGNALLAFRDNGGVGTQVTAAKVSPTGTLLWGASNVQLTNTSDFVAAPKIAGTADGGAVVAWTQDVTVHVQKLDGSGGAVWTEDLILTPTVGSYSASDLHDAGSDAILSIVHQLGGFGSPRRILAQKYDATGAGLWADPLLAIFEVGSLQFGNFPSFEPDGLGGALFSWYDTGAALQCYAQHVSSAGLELFPHNGSAASTNATRVRVSPSISFDAALDETYLFWTEQTSNQAMSGLYGQKFDSNGNRLWTDSGSALVNLGAASITNVSSVRVQSQNFVYWDRSPSFGTDVILGARVDGMGTMDLGPFDVATTPSSKSRLVAKASTTGFSILAWQDERVDSGDIFVQNVNSDGSLGGGTTSVGDGAISTSDVQLAAPFPNPARQHVQIRYDGDETDLLDITVFDSGGRFVRAIQSRGGASGVIDWDVRNETGQRVGPGLYFVRVRMGDQIASQSVTVIR